jgi:hypothetical protein
MKIPENDGLCVYCGVDKARLDKLEELIEEVIENYARGPLGEWAYVGNWMNRAKIIGEKSFNKAFERGRRAGGNL